MIRSFLAILASMFAVIFPSAAFAESVIDTTELTTQISGAGGDMKTVGMAMLGLVVIVVLLGMVRRVMR